MRAATGIALRRWRLSRCRQKGSQHDQRGTRRHTQARLVTKQPPGTHDRVNRLQRDDHARRARFQPFQAPDEQELRQAGAEHPEQCQVDPVAAG